MSEKKPSKQSTDFENELLSFHAELAAVFGDIGQPVFTHDKPPHSMYGETLSFPDLGASPSSETRGFGGEADLVLINAHIPTDKINPRNFQVEPDSPCWRVKVQDFGAGIVEVVAIKQFEKFRKKVSGKKESKTRDEMIPEQLALSVQRAKTAIRHKCISIRGDRMLTLTYRDNMECRDTAYTHFEKFAKQCKKEFGEFPYVAVTEKQERGAIHFHLVLNKYYPVNELRKFWHNAIGKREDGKSPGNIDIQKKASFIKANSNHKQTITKMARYLAKYLDKDIEGQQVGKKRYSSSRGIEKPRVQIYFIPFGENTFRLVGDIVLQENKVMIGKPLEFDTAIWWSSYT